MDYKEFFSTDNKSGWKTNQRLLEKNFPDIYSQVKSFIENNYDLSGLTFKEQIWYFIHDVQERKKCTCGDYVKWRGTLQKGYNEFCSQDCFNNNKDENADRVRKVIKEKYGVDYFSQHSSWLEKVQQTKKVRYGDINYNNTEQALVTKLEKYGNPNYVNVDKIIETKRNRDVEYIKTISEKSRNTSIKKYGADHYSKTPEFKNRIRDHFITRYPHFDFIKEKCTRETCTFICKECKQEVTTQKSLFRERQYVGHTPCTACMALGTTNQSSLQLALKNMLLDEGLRFTENVVLFEDGRQQLDIYFNDSKLAIECNGNYFHCELFRDSKYHLNKTIKCENLGVHLIHFFEDEILDKPEIVKSIILNRLGKSKETIYGRKTTIKEIDVSVYKNFMEENHIQGYSKSNIKIGLFYNGELVSAMGFSKTRLGIGKKEEDAYEMIRFANKKFMNIIGGADKLFKYFIKKYSPPKIISYADRRLFSGAVYEKLGFEKIGYSQPNYWYVINGTKRYHRFNYRKDKLVKQGYDKNKTEKQIMLERKIYRIYDCGTVKYVWYFYYN